jgi:antitoxin Phd
MSSVARKSASSVKTLPSTRVWSVKEARDHFGDLLNAADRGEPQRISRRGKTNFVLVSEEAWQKKEEADLSGDGFVAALLAFPGDEDFFIPPRSVGRPIPDFFEGDDE